MVGEKKRKRLGDILLEQQIITRDQLQIALIEQKKNKLALGKIIVSLGFVTEAVMRDVLSEALGQESIELISAVPDVEALKLVPKEMARRLKLIPINFDEQEQTLTVATVDSYDLPTLDRVRAHVGGGVQIKS